MTEDLPVAQLGGAGKHAVTLGRALLEAGHHVEMLGRVRASGIETSNDFPGRLHTTIDLSRTGWKEQAFGVFNPVRRLHAARRIWNAIRRCEGSWDVIHYHGHNPVLGAIVPPNLNFVQTLHDQGAECIIKVRFREEAPCSETTPAACAGCATMNPNSLQTFISSQAVRSLRNNARAAFSTHQAIFVSHFLEARFKRVVGGEQLRTHVIHNFIHAADINRSLTQTVSAPFQNDGRLKVLAAGRIDRMKGFGLFLAKIPDELLCSLNLVVVGDGPELADLRKRHEGRGVRFTGWQSQDYVITATASADVCVVPSIGEEACSTSILEGLALGRTVLAFDRGGTPELRAYEIRKGQLQLFNDTAALVRALSELPTTQAATLVDDLSDVNRRLPAILAVYRRDKSIAVLQDQAA